MYLNETQRPLTLRNPDYTILGRKVRKCRQNLAATCQLGIRPVRLLPSSTSILSSEIQPTKMK